jgi:uncharacterized protein YndB with AHSA1/START domain
MIQKSSPNAVIEATINLPISKVWEYYTQPEHVKNWNFASDDWHTPSAENDLRKGGKFNYRMEAKDGSAGFDFSGTYLEVIPQQKIETLLGDDRQVLTTFTSDSAQTKIVIQFELESTNTKERQIQGWQAILNNFKNYAENNGNISSIHR